MSNCCESLKSIIRRDLLREIDGDVWLGKFDKDAEENPPAGSVCLRHCLFCGEELENKYKELE